MKQIGTKKQTKELVEKHQFHIKKKFGQNFLTDPNLLQKIVDISKVDKDTLVIEIGPGMGALTEGLLRQAKHVLAYEIDKDLIPILQETFQNTTVTLIHDDILNRNIDEDIKSLNIDYKNVVLVANLPYYITTPIIMKFLEESNLVERLYVMMQKEVAERFTSNPSTKDYNSLSVFIQYKTSSQIVLRVPKQVFVPAPNVDSAVVEMIIKTKYDRVPQDEQLFYRVVRSAFQMRRKTLVNNLSKSFPYSKQLLSSMLEEIGHSPSVRAEELTVDDFITVSDYFAHL